MIVLVITILALIQGARGLKFLTGEIELFNFYKKNHLDISKSESIAAKILRMPGTLEAKLESIETHLNTRHVLNRLAASIILILIVNTVPFSQLMLYPICSTVGSLVSLYRLTYAPGQIYLLVIFILYRKVNKQHGILVKIIQNLIVSRTNNVKD